MDAYISANLCKEKGVQITEVMNTKEVARLRWNNLDFIYLFIYLFINNITLLSLTNRCQQRGTQMMSCLEMKR